MSKLFHWSVQEDEVKEVVIMKDIVQLRRRLWRLAEVGDSERERENPTSSGDWEGNAETSVEGGFKGGSIECQRYGYRV